jgi:hypothetical protein
LVDVQSFFWGVVFSFSFSFLNFLFGRFVYFWKVSLRENTNPKLQLLLSVNVLVVKTDACVFSSRKPYNTCIILHLWFSPWMPIYQCLFYTLMSQLCTHDRWGLEIFLHHDQ